MIQNLEELLHKRISTHCKKLVDNEHYQHAAFEAMKQVELAIKEKASVKNKCGVLLIKEVFGPGRGIKLRIPFGAERQKQAKEYLVGTFSYYRNHAAHDGSNIDRKLCLRILIIASDLLDLIGASSLSFVDIGGVSGLIQSGVFTNKDQIHSLLTFLNYKVLPDHVCDGFYEDLASGGFSESQLQAMFDLGLAEYRTESYSPSEIESIYDPAVPEELGIFELTELGNTVLNDFKKVNT